MRKMSRTTKETKTRLRGKGAIWKLFLLLLVCALCCAKTAQAEEAETQPEEPVKPPPAGLGGIQRGQCRTEYADGVFVVGTCGRRGQELLINTHVVKTEADFEFWRDVQCREKLLVGNENGRIIEVGKTIERLETEIAEMKTKMKNENVNLKAEVTELRELVTNMASKMDTFLQSPSPPPPSPPTPP